MPKAENIPVPRAATAKIATTRMQPATAPSCGRPIEQRWSGTRRTRSSPRPTGTATISAPDGSQDGSGGGEDRRLARAGLLGGCPSSNDRRFGRRSRS